MSIVTILPLTFRHSEEVLQKTRDDVRTHAIHRAKKNARETAQHMGIKLGHINQIDDVDIFEELVKGKNICIKKIEN